MSRLDPVSVGIHWDRLVSVVEEVATVLLRTSFTPVVREAGDLSAGLFDRRGRMMVQAVTGTPGHINTMATAVRHFAERFPLDSLEPGDTLAGNDPTPDDALRLAELQGRLEGAVQELPPAFLQLILLRHRQHCRYDEIARITDLPIGTVKNRIFRAREMLRTRLADLLGRDEPTEAR